MFNKISAPRWSANRRCSSRASCRGVTRAYWAVRVLEFSSDLQPYRWRGWLAETDSLKTLQLAKDPIILPVQMSLVADDAVQVTLAGNQCGGGLMLGSSFACCQHNHLFLNLSSFGPKKPPSAPTVPMRWQR
jgi:hypothetical protein